MTVLPSHPPTSKPVRVRRKKEEAKEIQVRKKFFVLTKYSVSSSKFKM